MSKSIYEKALEDLYYVILFGYSKDMIGKTIQTKRLLDFVKQAQKQEKLLEQIKKIINKPYNPYIMPMLEKPERYNEIVKLIKELENE